MRSSAEAVEELARQAPQRRPLQPDPRARGWHMVWVVCTSGLAGQRAARQIVEFVDVRTSHKMSSSRKDLARPAIISTSFVCSSVSCTSRILRHTHAYMVMNHESR